MFTHSLGSCLIVFRGVSLPNGGGITESMKIAAICETLDVGPISAPDWVSSSIRKALVVQGEITEARQPIRPLFRRDGPLTNGQRIDSTAVG